MQLSEARAFFECRLHLALHCQRARSSPALRAREIFRGAGAEARARVASARALGAATQVAGRTGGLVGGPLCKLQSSDTVSNLSPSRCAIIYLGGDGGIRTFLQRARAAAGFVHSRHGRRGARSRRRCPAARVSSRGTWWRARASWRWWRASLRCCPRPRQLPPWPAQRLPSWRAASRRGRRRSTT